MQGPESGTGATRALLIAAGAAARRLRRATLDFATRVYTKAGEDNIFFLAGAIAFNVLIAAIPFLLLVVAIFGFFLQSAVDDPQQAVLSYVFDYLPASQQLANFTTSTVRQIIEGRTSFGIAGLALFIWTSTRLIGTLRSVLREIFDLLEDRGIVAGKIYDAKMVVVAGSLFLANTAVSIGLETIRKYGVSSLGMEGRLDTVWRIWGQLLAFAFIFIMFVLIYRYLPARRISWRIALVAGTFTSVAFELMKGAFAWYVANFANFSMYGTLASLVLLVFWIYYASVVFILGGEVAQVYDLGRIRRQQREMLG